MKPWLVVRAWRSMRGDVVRTVPWFLVPPVYLLGSIIWAAFLVHEIRKYQRSPWGVH